MLYLSMNPLARTCIASQPTSAPKSGCVWAGREPGSAGSDGIVCLCYWHEKAGWEMEGNADDGDDDDDNDDG